MTTQPNTAVGVFRTHAAAQRAAQRLREAGFAEDEIGLVAQDPEQRYHGEAAERRTETEGSHAGSGATAGAATGAGVGALWGLGIVAGMLPAIGPVIAGGALASVLASAATAAVAGGLVGALIGLGIPEEEATYYDQEFEQGRTLVTVKNPSRYEEARQIMREESGYDYQTRDQAPRSEMAGDRQPGTSRMDAGGPAPSPNPRTTGRQQVFYDDVPRQH